MLQSLRRLAREAGPEILRQKRERAAERERTLARQRELEEAERLRTEAALATTEHAKETARQVLEAHIDALVEKHARYIAQGWRPEVFRSTKGYIDAWGKPADQDMIDLHERLSEPSRDG